MLSEREREVIASLRTQGYSVVIFTPEELGTAPPDKVENRLVELGNEVISVLAYD